MILKGRCQVQFKKLTLFGGTVVSSWAPCLIQPKKENENIFLIRAGLATKERIS